MSALSEITKPPMGAVLQEGLRVLSGNQEITFRKYARVVLPLDGFVFWVRTDLLTPSALANASVLNTWMPNQPQVSAAPASVMKVKGSFHFSTEQTQQEDENNAVNRVVFSAESEVLFLNEISPNSMWVGEFPADGAGNMLKFSFSAHARFYQQMDIWHYTGDAVYASMLSQLVDSAGQLDTRNVVVSNSLPFWLTLQSVCPVYPSYLIPDNLPPPYASVNIESTTSLQPLPYIDQNGSHWQLCEDKVEITTLGLRNFNALDFLDAALAKIGYDGDPVGLTDGPVVLDVKRWQVELGALAQKKSIQLSVSYYQTRLREIALQLIKSVIIHYDTQGQV